MAMNGPFAEGYMKAQQLEIDTLKKMDVWEIVDREPWMNVLPVGVNNTKSLLYQ